MAYPYDPPKMEKKIVIGVFLVVISLLVVGYWQFIGFPSSWGRPSDLVTAGAVYRDPQVQQVDEPTPIERILFQGIDIMGKDGFSKTEVHILPGDTIIWTNKDPAGKKIVVTFQKDQTREFVNSPILAPGESFQFTFQEKGTFNFWNLAYAGEGQIIVE